MLVCIPNVCCIACVIPLSCVQQSVYFAELSGRLSYFFVRILGELCEMGFLKLPRILQLLSICAYLHSDVDAATCSEQVRCDDCITARSDCAWCNDTMFVTGRCSTRKQLTAAHCTDIVSPNNSVKIVKAVPLRDGNSTTDPVQVEPQHVRVEMRPGTSHTEHLKYRVATNLPLDMYFLLDFSTTMSPKIALLANLTQELIKLMKANFTENINIGFGSFLDKVAQPFSLTTKQFLANPCYNSSTCEPTYGFRHRQSLHKDIKKFIEDLRRSNTSANFDPMEGGLDAVMQVAVCKEIGWRNHSRRVLIYMSDTGFHFAGDGKLAGIDPPNDGQCHLTPFGDGQFEYAASSTQDYPSLGQVREVLSKNNINTFFVVDESFKTMYRSFSDMIPQAVTTSMSGQGAREIVDSIRSFYTNLSQTVEIMGKDIPSELNVQLSTHCLRGVEQVSNLKTETSVCSDLILGQPVEFVLNVTMLECPSTVRTRSFNVQPVGIQEVLTVELVYTCDCGCRTSEALDDEYCTNGNGTYECGVCFCNPGRTGDTCQCDSKEGDRSAIQTSHCQRYKDSEVLCENNGVCKCGKCSCLKNYVGRFCECDNNRCITPGTTNVMCSGKDKGECSCDSCLCKNGYHGPYCECPGDHVCKSENGLVCNGRGKCECGQCRCHGGYRGDHCTECQSCDICRSCGQEACVRCILASRDILHSNGTCMDVCDITNITRSDSFADESGRTISPPCGVKDPTDDDCEILFLVTCDENKKWPHLQIAKNPQCVQPPDPLQIALPILAGIVGVGIMTLIIWKTVTTFYDRAEYHKLEKELKEAKWSETVNPIYKEAVTEHKNPMFQGSLYKH